MAPVLLAGLLALGTLAACGGGGSDPEPKGGSGGVGGTGGGGGTGGEGGTGGAGGTGGEGGTGGAGGTGGEGGCGTLPSIDRLEPAEGPVGADVTIVGCNFHPEASRNKVSFNSTLSSTSSVSEDLTRIVTKVPYGATTGKVSVLVGDIRIDGPSFRVTKVLPEPKLDTLDPAGTTEGAADTTLRLFGTGFVEESRVFMGEDELPTQFLTVTSLQVVIPAAKLATPGTLNFRVVNEVEGIAGGGVSSWQTFRVVRHLDLLRAIAVGPKHVALLFDRNVGPSAKDPRNYALSGGLVVEGVQGGDKVIYLETRTDMAQNRNVTVTASEEVRSAEGGAIWKRTALFRTYRSLPEPLGAFGSAGCSGTTLEAPAGVTVTADRVYVPEREGHQVQVLDRDGNLLGFLGHTGEASGYHEGAGFSALGCPGDGAGLAGGFKAPRGKVAVDNVGNQLIADTGNGRIQKFDSAGSYQSTVGSGFAAPVIMGVDHDSRIWVADANDQIRLMSWSGGTIGTFGGPGTANAQFAFATTATGAPAMDWVNGGQNGIFLYVTDPGNHRLHRFKATDAGSLQPWGWLGVNHDTGFQNDGVCCQAGTRQGEFTTPKGIVTDLIGTLWVIDEAGGGRLQRFNVDGATLMTPVQLGFIPGGIAIDDLGFLWIANESGDAVHKYRI